MKATQSKMRRIQIVIGLLLAVGLPFCHLGDLGRKYSGLGPLFGGEVLWWILFAPLFFTSCCGLISCLNRVSQVTDGTSCSAFCAVLMFVGCCDLPIPPALLMRVDQQLKSIIQSAIMVFACLPLRAAVVEETAFRGYGLTHHQLTGSRVLAVATRCLFLPLTSWGWAQVIIAAFGGLVLTLLLWAAKSVGRIVPIG
jgi:membrane protease YdiL (CAAX protease family)